MKKEINDPLTDIRSCGRHPDPACLQEGHQAGHHIWRGPVRILHQHPVPALHGLDQKAVLPLEGGGGGGRAGVGAKEAAGISVVGDLQKNIMLTNEQIDGIL